MQTQKGHDREIIIFLDLFFSVHLIFIITSYYKKERTKDFSGKIVR